MRTTRSNDVRGLFRETFRRLRAAGVFARMNYACCGTCASYEMDQEAEPAQPYAYMHAQDMERFDGDHLEPDVRVYVGYGIGTGGEGSPPAHEPTDGEVVAVGHLIRREAEAVGLRVDWDGTSAMRVGLYTETLSAAVADRIMELGR